MCEHHRCARQTIETDTRNLVHHQHLELVQRLWHPSRVKSKIPFHPLTRGPFSAPIRAIGGEVWVDAGHNADAAAALAAIGVLRSTEGAALRARLCDLIERVRPGHPSPIIPVILGDESTAVAASRWLLEQGLLVPAIRPPTVPVGSSRLRVALCAAHTDEQIDALIEALDSLAREDRP